MAPTIQTPDGTCTRDYIHVSDFVRAHSDALRYLRTGSASLTLNCGYGHGFSVREVIEMVKRVSGVDFKVEIAPRRPGDAAQTVAASERARATLGWTPQYDDLATIIGHALAWEQRLAKNTSWRTLSHSEPISRVWQAQQSAAFLARCGCRSPFTSNTTRTH